MQSYTKSGSGENTNPGMGKTSHATVNYELIRQTYGLYQGAYLSFVNCRAGVI